MNDNKKQIFKGKYWYWWQIILWVFFLFPIMLFIGLGIEMLAKREFNGTAFWIAIALMVAFSGTLSFFIVRGIQNRLIITFKGSQLKAQRLCELAHDTLIKGNTRQTSKRLKGYRQGKVSWQEIDLATIIEQRVSVAWFDSLNNYNNTVHYTITALILTCQNGEELTVDISDYSKSSRDVIIDLVEKVTSKKTANHERSVQSIQVQGRVPNFAMFAVLQLKGKFDFSEINNLFRNPIREAVRSLGFSNTVEGIEVKRNSMEYNKIHIWVFWQNTTRDDAMKAIVKLVKENVPDIPKDSLVSFYEGNNARGEIIFEEYL